MTKPISMKRFQALDIFRGMTVCLMIIVNTPGDWGATFSPLLHAKWHGFTPTDLVFPSFLFAVGTAFAFVRKRWKNKTLKEVIGKILKRTIIIFLLGYLMYWFPFMKWNTSGELTSFPIGETRILGVLQRIALCYFAAAIMIFYLSNRQLIYASIGLLLGYWALMYGFGDYTLENNFARTADRFLLGDAHLYGGDGLPFDPEGLLSTLPAIVNVIGGYLLGYYLLKSKISYEKLTKILLAGATLTFIGYVWHLSFPVNKKLWTSSFVALTIGLDLVIIAAIIYLTEFIKKPVNFNFFEIFGKNPLIIYLFSEYLAITFLFIRVDGKQNLYSWIYQHGFSWLGKYYGSFAFALIFMLICWAVGWWMNKRKWYVRV